MENWIRNLDSFYVTKDDQKISFSDDFIKSEERVTGLGKVFILLINILIHISGKKIVRIIIILSGYPKWMRILKRFIGRIVLCVKIRMAIRQFLICKVY